MKIHSATVFVPLAFLLVSLSGCAATGSADEVSSGEGDQSSLSENPDGGNSEFSAAGGAVVEVDGEKFEYGTFGCELEYAASDGKTYAWAGGAIRTSDKKSVSFQVGAFDPSGQGRYSGDGVSYNIVVLGYGSPPDSSVNVNANGTAGVTISGDPGSVSENTLNIAGQFAAEDGTTHDIRVDARCASSGG